MNILYCGDSGVCDGLALSALSLAKHATERLDFYILTASVDIGAKKHRAIDSAFCERLRSALCESAECTVSLFDLSERFGEYSPTANMDTRFTPLCMLRLYADTVPTLPDRLLYLDCDVLCRGDFSELYRTPMDKADIAGVPDRYGKYFFGNILRHDYFNSGVLLLNMTRIRENGLFEACRAMCREKKMFMPDQSALNKLAVKKRVGRRFNEQGRIRRRTVFKHFTTYFKLFPYVRPVTVKPWQVDAMHGTLGIFEFDDILEKYERIHHE